MERGQRALQAGIIQISARIHQPFVQFRLFAEGRQQNRAGIGFQIRLCRGRDIAPGQGDSIAEMPGKELHQRLLRVIGKEVMHRQALIAGADHVPLPPGARMRQARIAQHIADELVEAEPAGVFRLALQLGALAVFVPAAQVVLRLAQHRKQLRFQLELLFQERGNAAAELAGGYSAATGRPWTQPIGFKHALFEVVADVISRSADLQDPAANVAAIAETDINTIVGPVNWANGPVKNVTKTPLVAGQWQQQGDGIDLKIVANATAPQIPLTGDLMLLG